MSSRKTDRSDTPPSTRDLEAQLRRTITATRWLAAGLVLSLGVATSAVLMAWQDPVEALMGETIDYLRCRQIHCERIAVRETTDGVMKGVVLAPAEGGLDITRLHFGPSGGSIVPARFKFHWPSHGKPTFEVSDSDDRPTVQLEGGWDPRLTLVWADPERRRVVIDGEGGLTIAGSDGATLARVPPNLPPSHHGPSHPVREAQDRLRPAYERLLAGATVEVPPGDRVVLAAMLRDDGHDARSAQMYAQAFDEDRRLTTTFEAQHLYDAARSAARAGGEWLARASTWLRTDLERRRRDLTTSPAWVAYWLQRWQSDPDLAAIRDGAELDAELEQLWQNVQTALDEASQRLQTRSLTGR